jgi:hypothetical protein
MKMGLSIHALKTPIDLVKASGRRHLAITSITLARKLARVAIPGLEAGSGCKCYHLLTSPMKDCMPSGNCTQKIL